jgi:hypothetical protein
VRGDKQQLAIIDDGSVTSLSSDGEVVVAVPNSDPASSSGWEIRPKAEIVLCRHTPNEWRMVGALTPDPESCGELEVDQVGGDRDCCTIW